MGAYKYCTECDAPLQPASPRDDLIDGQTCPNCGKTQHQEKSLNEWVVDLYEELEELKNDLRRI